MVYSDIHLPLPGYIALDWSLMTLALIPIILRLFLRWRTPGRCTTSTNVSDSFIVVAWISGIVLISINTWKNTLREKYRTWPASNLYYGVPHDLSARLLYVSWISLYFIYISLWMSKAALIAFYYSILREQGERAKLVLFAASVFTAGTFLLHMVLLTFWCHPISGNWNVDGDLCSAVHSIHSVTISTFSNVATDLVIISIPISTLIKMRLGRRELYGLFFVFCMGSVSIIAALARFVTLELVRKVPRVSITHTIDIWALVEIVSSLLAACLPSLRTFVRRHRPASAQQNYRQDSAGSNWGLTPLKTGSMNHISTRPSSASEFLRKESEVVSPSEAWFDERYITKASGKLDLESSKIAPFTQKGRPAPVAYPAWI